MKKFYLVLMLCFGFVLYAPSMALSQGASTNTELLQALSEGGLSTSEAASILADRAGIDLSQAQEILSNLQEQLDNIGFEDAVSLLDDLSEGQISAEIAEVLSELPDLGDIIDLSEIEDILDGLEGELQDILTDLGIEELEEQIANIVEQIGGLEALEAVIEEGAEFIAEIIEDIAPELVELLGGVDAIADAISEALGIEITLNPPETGDPGACSSGCDGSQNRDPTTPGSSCSFCQGIGSGCSSTITSNHNRIRTHMSEEFTKHREWLENIWWGQHVLPALTKMNLQFSAVAIQQVNIIGKFFDAKHQLEVQRTMQQLSAEAYKDYTPSEGLCEVGTNIRSLAASERKSDVAYIAVANRQLNRNVRAKDTPGSTGTESDKLSRRAQFIENYCDKTNNANGLTFLCQSGTAEPARFNKDINYTASFLNPLTLDIDMTSTGSISEEHEDIFALSANLYAHDVLPAIPARSLADGAGRPRQKAYNYMDLRSIVAKRSVATNSFSAIMGLKSNGDDEVAPFLKKAVTELGIPDDEINYVLGEEPSYHAQMEVLTKKLYQNPVFYTELYDKPANVRRKGVTLRAINLMQERDIYDSLLRSEAILAVTLETMLEDESERINSRLENLTTLTTDMDTVPR